MDAFLGEIRTFSFSFAPRDWAQCNGQLLPVNQNQALFSLLGTAYGGDGSSTFGLPNLQGRVTVGVGSGGGSVYGFGAVGGAAAVAISASEIPAHHHLASVSSAANSTSTPSSALLPGAFPSLAGYSPDGSQLAGLNMVAVANAGGGQTHENRQPSLALNMCICLSGIYPSRP